jgi:hypothetical protein
MATVPPPPLRGDQNGRESTSPRESRLTPSPPPTLLAAASASFPCPHCAQPIYFHAGGLVTAAVPTDVEIKRAFETAYAALLTDPSRPLDELRAAGCAIDRLTVTWRTLNETLAHTDPTCTPPAHSLVFATPWDQRLKHVSPQPKSSEWPLSQPIRPNIPSAFWYRYVPEEYGSSPAPAQWVIGARSNTVWEEQQTQKHPFLATQILQPAIYECLKRIHNAKQERFGKIIKGETGVAITLFTRDSRYTGGPLTIRFIVRLTPLSDDG